MTTSDLELPQQPAGSLDVQQRAMLAAAGASGTWDWDIVQDRLFVDGAFSQLYGVGSEQAAAGTWGWDIVQDLLFVDGAFAELYGFDPEQASAGLPVKSFFSAIHPDDR